MILLMIIIVLACAILAYMTLKTKNNQQDTIASETKDTEEKIKNADWDLSMYFLKGSILTEVELKFYKRLSELIPEEYTIAPKVGLKDFITIRCKENYMKHFGHISQKHIDFLICKRNNMSPAIGIELDDSTHKQKSRAERDKMVDEIYNQIGLKIIHIPLNTSSETLTQIIEELFK